MESATARMQLLSQLEDQLRKLSFTDPAVREVRKQVRAAAESVLLATYAAAQERRVEVRLWQRCFHQPVSEFRRRIAEARAKREKGKELLVKWMKAFSTFLLDAIDFYKALAAKLQLVYGDVGFKLSTRDRGTYAQQLAGVKVASKPEDVRDSVSRCLICTGDLTRYHLDLGPSGTRDWSKANAFYCQASRIHPEGLQLTLGDSFRGVSHVTGLSNADSSAGGNAYNQRAVLAGYEKKDLEAIYFYVRSLAVASAPFLIAKENLRQQFELVRQSHQQLSSEQPAPGAARSLHGRKLVELTRSVEIGFLHLHGLLFTHIDFDTFPSVIKAAMKDFDDLLGRGTVVKGPPGHGPNRSDVKIFLLAALTLFPAHNLPDSDGPSQAELAKRAELRRAALDLVFVFTGRLAKALAAQMVGTEAGIAGSPLLPSMSILLQWLSTHAEELRDKEEKGPGARTYLCVALSELVGAANMCWQSRHGPNPADKEPGSSAISSAFPEDVELRAFVPLLQAQQSIDYTKILTEEESVEPRFERVVALLRSLGDQMRAAGLAENAGCDPACKAVTGFLVKVGGSFSTSSHQQPGGPADTNVDEDCELIVYQPSPAQLATQAPEPLTDEPSAIGTLQPEPEAADQTLTESREPYSDPFTADGLAAPPPLASQRTSQQTETPSQQQLNLQPPQQIVPAQPSGPKSDAGVFQQLSQEYRSRGPSSYEPSRATTPDLLRSGTSRPAGGLTAPPGFPQPGIQTMSGTSGNGFAMPATSANLGRPLDAMLGQTPQRGHVAPAAWLAAGQTHQRSEGLGAQWLGRGQATAAVPGLENYAGFYPQSPLPSLLPTDLLGGALAADPLAQNNFSHAAAPYQIPQSLPQPATRTAQVQDIWQGLGLPVPAQPDQGAFGQWRLPAGGLQHPHTAGSGWNEPQRQGSGAAQAYLGFPGPRTTDLDALQQLLAQRAQAPPQPLPGLQELLSRVEPQQGLAHSNGFVSQHVNTDLLAALRSDHLPSDVAWGSHSNAGLPGPGLGALYGMGGPSELRRQSPQPMEQSPSGVESDSSWLDAFEAQQRRLASRLKGSNQ